MTEAEWLSATDPERMLRLLRFGAAGRIAARLARIVGRKGVARPRKLHLFAQACYHHVGQDLEALEAGSTSAEQSLDADAVARWCCWVAANRATREFGGDTEPAASVDDAVRLLPPDIQVSLARVASAGELAAYRAELVAQSAMLRDVFGNPFRPVTFDSGWRTTTAHQLAQGMYDSRDFLTMPILADALQDAGCENDDILDHCRGPGPHVRGCWVVDLVLDKG